ncbi:hypothetical protein M4578_00135 [Salipiger sp. P9]|uniref:hypothetical protein n=1 Tax=Salipiger pentaromativorans TaxID=2943193 RepID=UPI0021581F18|nr:hypothetical protein [Salipiger pentaromativorans]MCR8546216.1 hypothetical protein [Salipiger pentaromativorans]
MDYSKMGGARGGSNAPRYDRHKDAAAGKPAAGGKATKAELLERMKQAQQKRKES